VPLDVPPNNLFRILLLLADAVVTSWHIKEASFQDEDDAIYMYR
jgi:hypothetical protein